MGHYDVAVVGGGPSGSTAAAILADAGMTVVLLERRRLKNGKYDRLKPCGGGLDALFWEMLAPSIPVEEAQQAIVEHWIYNLVARYGGKHETEYRRDQPFFAMGMRDRIDGYLATKAVECGVELISAKVEGLRRSPKGGYRVEGAEVSAKYVIGADGAYGVTAKSLGIEGRRQVFLASEHEVDVAEPSMWEGWAGRSLIDVGRYPLIGYNWIFTKAYPHLSIGWGMPRRMGSKLNSMTSKIFADNGVCGEVKRTAHWIPFYKGGPIAQDRALLVGDAAGLCNPSNGAGISWGMKSAHCAAAAILAEEACGGSAARTYTRMVSKKLLGPYRRARAMWAWNMLKINIIPRLGMQDEKIWGAFIDDLRGELDYETWARENWWKALVGRALLPVVDHVLVRA